MRESAQTGKNCVFSSTRLRCMGVSGRPPLDKKGPRVQMARALHKDRDHEVKDICQSLNISHSTLYRYLAMPT
jgi:hypothetical protein